MYFLILLTFHWTVRQLCWHSSRYGSDEEDTSHQSAPIKPWVTSLMMIYVSVCLCLCLSWGSGIGDSVHVYTRFSICMYHWMREWVWGDTVYKLFNYSLLAMLAMHCVVRLLEVGLPWRLKVMTVSMKEAGAGWQISGDHRDTTVVMETQAHTHLVPGVCVMSVVERIDNNVNSNGLD